MPILYHYYHVSASVTRFSVTNIAVTISCVYVSIRIKSLKNVVKSCKKFWFVEMGNIFIVTKDFVTRVYSLTALHAETAAGSISLQKCVTTDKTSLKSSYHEKNGVTRTRFFLL